MTDVYLVVVPYYWGNGNTLSEAVENVREAGFCDSDFEESETEIYHFSYDESEFPDLPESHFSVNQFEQICKPSEIDESEISEVDFSELTEAIGQRERRESNPEDVYLPLG